MGCALWKKECIKGVAGAQNGKEECQIYAAERRWGLRSVQTSGGAPERGGVRSTE